MIRTILAPNAPWPVMTKPRPVWKAHRGNCIDPNALVEYIKRGEDTIDLLVLATGFSREGIRTHLYKLRKDEVIEAIPVHGKATLWRAR